MKSTEELREMQQEEAERLKDLKARVTKIKAIEKDRREVIRELEKTRAEIIEYENRLEGREDKAKKISKGIMDYLYSLKEGMEK